jgi:hypothetical protein
MSARQDPCAPRWPGLASGRGSEDGELALNDFGPLFAEADSGRLSVTFFAELERKSR